MLGDEYLVKACFLHVLKYGLDLGVGQMLEDLSNDEQVRRRQRIGAGIDLLKDHVLQRGETADVPAHDFTRYVGGLIFLDAATQLAADVEVAAADIGHRPDAVLLDHVLSNAEEAGRPFPVTAPAGERPGSFRAPDSMFINIIKALLERQILVVEGARLEERIARAKSSFFQPILQTAQFILHPLQLLL